MLRIGSGRRCLTGRAGGGTNLAPGYPGFASGWTPVRSTLATRIAGDPFNGSNAARLTEDLTGSASHGIDLPSTLSIAAGATYTFEVLYKAGSSGTRNTALFFADSGFANEVAVVFNQTTGAVVADISAGTHNLVNSGSSVSNGWIKAYITGNLPGVSAVQLGVFLASGSTFAYTGDGASNNLIYGPYLVAGTQAP